MNWGLGTSSLSEDLLNLFRSRKYDNLESNHQWKNKYLNYQ